MKKRVMITTIFLAKAIKVAITKLSPDKVICVVEKGYDKLLGKDAETKRQSIKELKDAFKGVVEIELLETKSLYDIYEITKDVVNKIDELYENNDIFIHISEGRKSLAFGLSFASYMRRDKIKGIYYLVSDVDELMKLPSFSFQINDSQKKILKEINDEKTNDIESLQVKLKKSRSIIYHYVRNLQNENYLLNENGKLKLTDIGRMVIL